MHSESNQKVKHQASKQATMASVKKCVVSKSVVKKETYSSIKRDIREMVKTRCIIDWKTSHDDDDDDDDSICISEDSQDSFFDTDDLSDYIEISDLYEYINEIKDSFSPNDIMRLREIIHCNAKYGRAFLSSVCSTNPKIDDYQEKELFTSIITVRACFTKPDLDELLVKIYKLSNFI